MSLALVLAVVALILGCIAVAQSDGKSGVGWAVILLAAIHLLGAVNL